MTTNFLQLGLDSYHQIIRTAIYGVHSRSPTGFIQIQNRNQTG